MPEKPICYRFPWFKFNNLGMALGMSLKFYANVAKGLKLSKSQKVLGANSYVSGSYRGKTGSWAFLLKSWQP